MTYKQFSPKTDKKINWVMSMFSEWRRYRNEIPNMDSVMLDFDDLHSVNKEELGSVLCCFITEVQKLDDTNFPPKTLYDIIVCIQFFLEKNGIMWKLLDEPVFKDVKFTLDNLLKVRCSEGLGRSV